MKITDFDRGIRSTAAHLESHDVEPEPHPARPPQSSTPRWTYEQAQFLAERYHRPRWPAKCIAAELGRSEKAVHGKARALGLTRPAGPGSNSIRQQLIRLGIPQRTFYNVREELVELGAEHTTEDIIEICQARSRA